MKWLTCLFLLTLPAAIFGDEPPRFIVHSRDGGRPPGLLTQWKPDGSLQVGQRAFESGSWISVRKTGSTLPALLSKNFVLLTNGDRIPLDPQAFLRADDERLYFQPSDPLRSATNPRLSVPIAYVVLLCFEPNGLPSDTERIIRELTSAKRDRDVVILRGGDRVEGKISGLNVEQLKLTGATSANDLALDQVGMIVWNTRYQTIPKQRQTYGHAVLAGGGRMSVTGAQLDTTRTFVKTQSIAGPVEIPLQKLLSFDRRQGVVDYLSDLKPHSFEHLPFFGVNWPLARDACVTDEPLRMADSTYDKGLGMHSQSAVTYTLGGVYVTFEALVGIDDSAPRMGQARIAIYVDGKKQKLPGGHLVRAGAEPMPIRIDIGNAQEVRLVVDYGELGDVGGRVDWADARLVKK